jgi:hypothetical protein
VVLAARKAALPLGFPGISRASSANSSDSLQVVEAGKDRGCARGICALRFVIAAVYASTSL